MGCLRLIFVLVVLFTGPAAFFNQSWPMGLCGTLSPAFAIFGGTALAAGFVPAARRSYRQALTGAAAIAVALAWAAYTGWHFTLWGYDISGVAENIIGAGVGLTFGFAQDAVRAKLAATPEP